MTTQLLTPTPPAVRARALADQSYRHAAGVDACNLPYEITRVGATVLVYSPSGFRQSVEVDVYPTVEQAAAEYGNWWLDPSAHQPHRGDVIDDVASGRRILVESSAATGVDTWAVTGRCVLARGGLGARVTVSAYPRSLVYVTRPVGR